MPENPVIIPQLIPTAPVQSAPVIASAPAPDAAAIATGPIATGDVNAGNQQAGAVNIEQILAAVAAAPAPAQPTATDSPAAALADAAVVNAPSPVVTPVNNVITAPDAGKVQVVNELNKIAQLENRIEKLETLVTTATANPEVNANPVASSNPVTLATASPTVLMQCNTSPLEKTGVVTTVTPALGF